MSFLDTEHSLPALWKRIKALIHLHTDRTDNPHGVTKAQVGLGNVDNTADKDKAVASATKATTDAKGNDISSTYLPKTDASNTYLTKTDAANTYLTKTNAAGSYTKTAVKGNAESSYRTGNVNLTSDNLGITGTAPTDLNNAINSGMWHVNSGHSNLPSGGESYGQLLVVRGNSDTIAQLFFNYSSDRVFIRTGNPVSNSSGKWNAWTELYSRVSKPSKADVGLGSVDNTSDKDKSVKYATSAGSAKDSSKLPLAGGTMNDGAQISRAGNSVSWVGGRSGAMVRQTSYTGYNPIASVKTTNGSWEVGPHANDLLHLSYITDANYNKGTNTQTVDIYVGPDGKIHGKITNADVASTAKDTQKVHSQTMTLSASAWSSNAQTLAPTYVTASNTVIVKPPYGYEDAYNSAEIKAVSQGAKSLKFTCSTKPTADINVVILTIT